MVKKIISIIGVSTLLCANNLFFNDIKVDSKFNNSIISKYDLTKYANNRKVQFTNIKYLEDNASLNEKNNLLVEVINGDITLKLSNQYLEGFLNKIPVKRNINYKNVIFDSYLLYINKKGKSNKISIANKMNSVNDSKFFYTQGVKQFKRLIVKDSIREIYLFSKLSFNRDKINRVIKIDTSFSKDNNKTITHIYNLEKIR